MKFNKFIFDLIFPSLNRVGLFIFFFASSMLNAQQDKIYEIYQGFEKIDRSDLVLSFYKSSVRTDVLGDKKGTFEIQKDLITSADSIKLFYSFYEITIHKEQFNKSRIIIDLGLSLEEIVLTEDKESYYGPGKRSLLSTKGFIQPSGFFKLISIPTDSLNDRNINGLRVMFLGKGIWSSNTSKNKTYDLKLFGFNNPEDIQLTSLLLDEVQCKTNNKGRGWYEHRNLDLNDYSNFKYIAFGIKVGETGDLNIAASKSRYFPEFNNLRVFQDSRGIRKIEVLNNSNLIANIQLILQ